MFTLSFVQPDKWTLLSLHRRVHLLMQIWMQLYCEINMHFSWDLQWRVPAAAAQGMYVL